MPHTTTIAAAGERRAGTSIGRRLALGSAFAALLGAAALAAPPADGRSTSRTLLPTAGIAAGVPGPDGFELVRTCAGRRVTIVHPGDGTPLDGTPGDDVILGSDANDTIRGHGGDDVICGGNGGDRIDAGAGGDLVLGGRGNDTLVGSDGADTLLGEDGRDTLLGARGADYHHGGDGDDVLHADLSDDGSRDMVYGGPGNDRLRTRDGVGNDVGHALGGFDGCHVDPGDAIVGCHYYE